MHTYCGHLVFMKSEKHNPPLSSYASFSGVVCLHYIKKKILKSLIFGNWLIISFTVDERVFA